MNKIGFLTNQLIQDQKSFSLVREINKINYHDSIDCIVFYNDMGVLTAKNEFALMHCIEALDYDGILVATDIITAHVLLNCLRTKKKYFYVWDINWHIQQRPINFIKQIYCNEEIDLIARSEDHADLISKVFKKPAHILEDFDHEQIQTIVHSEGI